MLFPVDDRNIVRQGGGKLEDVLDYPLAARVLRMAFAGVEDLKGANLEGYPPQTIKVGEQ